MTYKISLGDEKKGVTLGNWTFRIPGKFEIERTREPSGSLPKVLAYLSLPAWNPKQPHPSLNATAERKLRYLENHLVNLRNHDCTLRLTSDGRRAYIEIYGTWRLFDPFLRIEWLERMIGKQSWIYDY